MHFITRLYQSSLFKTVACNLILILIFTFVTPVFSQDTGAKLLADGIKLYTDGKIDQAIAKLSSCVDRVDLNQDQLIDAYKYLAQAYMAKEFRDQAKQAVEKLLRIMPNYKPDPVEDRPQYIELVEKVREEQAVQQQPAQKQGIWAKYKTWILIGGGAVVVTILAIILWPSAEDEDLPKPPDFPR